MATWKKILTEGNVIPGDLASGGDAGEILKVASGGTAIEWGTASGSGTVTEVTVGAGTIEGIGLSVSSGTTTPVISLSGSLTEQVTKTKILDILKDEVNSADVVYIGDGGNDTTVRVRGTLIVDGPTTTVSSEIVTIDDNVIVLNSNATGTPSEDGGFTIERGSAQNKSLFWDESDEMWAIGDTVGTPLSYLSGFKTNSGVPTGDQEGLGQIVWDTSGTNLYIRTV
jgi:hypothetical protein